MRDAPLASNFPFPMRECGAPAGRLRAVCFSTAVPSRPPAKNPHARATSYLTPSPTKASIQRTSEKKRWDYTEGGAGGGPRRPCGERVFALFVVIFCFHRSAATTVTLSRVPLRIASATMLFAIACANSGPSTGAAGLSGLLPGFPTPRVLSDPTRPSDITLLVLRGGAGLLEPCADMLKLYDADGSFTPGMPCVRERVERERKACAGTLSARVSPRDQNTTKQCPNYCFGTET